MPPLPASVEVGGWASQLQQGMTAEQVIAAFVASPEYFQEQGSSTSAWLDHAYQDLLGRQPDPGSQGFLVQLSGGISLIVVATALASSTEYRTRLIAQVYATYLQRQAGPSDVQAWLPIVSQAAAGPGKPA